MHDDFVRKKVQNPQPKVYGRILDGAQFLFGQALGAFGIFALESDEVVGVECDASQGGEVLGGGAVAAATISAPGGQTKGHGSTTKRTGARPVRSLVILSETRQFRS
jgi:hypothetical protein